MPRVSGSAWPWLLADDSDAIVGVRSGNIDQLFVFSNDDALNIDMSNLAATWNASGTTFAAVKMNVTDTASAAGSLLLDLQVGGTSRFKVGKGGEITLAQGAANAAALTATGYSLTGSSAVSLVDVAGTWNTTGTPTLVKANVTDTASNAASLLMDLQAGGVSKFKVSKTGNVTLAGNLVVASGNGIDFSATAGTGTSELLSDYEEGTWTAEFADAETGGNVSAVTAGGTYTKVGRTVVAAIGGFINIDTTGLTAGNRAWVRGLPFASSSAGFHFGSLDLRNAAFTGSPTVLLEQNKTAVYVRNNTSGGGFAALTVADFTDDTSWIIFSIVYQTA